MASPRRQVQLGGMIDSQRREDHEQLRRPRAASKTTSSFEDHELLRRPRAASNGDRLATEWQRQGDHEQLRRLSAASDEERVATTRRQRAASERDRLTNDQDNGYRSKDDNGSRSDMMARSSSTATIKRMGGSWQRAPAARYHRGRCSSYDMDDQDSKYDNFNFNEIFKGYT
ncbi:hypothetical protein PHYSODRAFT_331025 [Phytophthora sojae]|uniref:Uncharacterized protein n=1 Tax=Phytophthora sojae (strain P6497) TaxID=1094619 RepID=G4ZES6_PHYSP|nr:hypothetical protein PHYSODRAFT_331025 [Phytophthora sojae]EGZ16990.1 hypothetical protein PHYSODRAFT_331025 [Phytophthora sojae]|eukprot:XP_009526048.1 hypothetical protein PHYSODRAFT_331025 [Phytophthora sojae]